jgi:hypothetical protein
MGLIVLYVVAAVVSQVGALLGIPFAMMVRLTRGLKMGFVLTQDVVDMWAAFGTVLAGFVVFYLAGERFTWLGVAVCGMPSVARVLSLHFEAIRRWQFNTVFAKLLTVPLTPRPNLVWSHGFIGTVIGLALGGITCVSTV